MTISLPEEVHCQVVETARFRNQSRASLVREAVEAFLSKDCPKVVISVYDAIKDIPIVRGGVDIVDLSTNPKYLEGYGDWRLRGARHERHDAKTSGER